MVRYEPLGHVTRRQHKGYLHKSVSWVERERNIGLNPNEYIHNIDMVCFKGSPRRGERAHIYSKHIEIRHSCYAEKQADVSPMMSCVFPVLTQGMGNTVPTRMTMDIKM